MFKWKVILAINTESVLVKEPVLKLRQLNEIISIVTKENT